ncbi:DUF3375 domain-containing protein [Corynebacterium imitans]|uniref:DUF3375 domain-containing protein n=1 Tax=Corynebacterium imitans TaxID=156978 RepID=UPI001EF36E0A|nr:DUF3375 domain-containing protein [Corynebacterium imitans]MCG7277422.1 DUF3375 domain-containing protein [Corynebacterium imitans]
MNLVADALKAKRIGGESAALSLMRSPLMPVVVAFIKGYFPHGSKARPVVEVYEGLSTDLRLLRAEGFDLASGPQHYVSEWVKKGWLTRRTGTSRTGETVEPSEEALAVVETLERWDAPQRAVTASRIETISQALHRLARDADPTIEARLALLEEQRELIERQIAETERGEFDVLSPVQVRERIGDILDLAAGIPADFARVRHEMEALNRRLRRQLLDPEEQRGSVLEDIFRGVDMIGSSDAGKSFTSFYEVLLDRERSAQWQQWTDQVLAHEMPEDEGGPDVEMVRKLGALFHDMERASFDVNQEMTSLARSLRHYVTSDEFAENRRMVALLRETRHAAAVAAQQGEVQALTPMETKLVRIGMSIGSVSALKLRNPGEEIVEYAVQPIQEVPLDEEALRNSIRESEIDFEEIDAAIARALQRKTQASLLEVVHEAGGLTQGLASVVGFLYRAMESGFEGGVDKVELTWDDDGTHYRAAVGDWYFTAPDTPSTNEADHD